MCRIPEVVFDLENCLGYEAMQSCLHHMARQGGGVVQQVLFVDDDASRDAHNCTAAAHYQHLDAAVPARL